MRHRKVKLQLNRFTSWRKATLISLARNLLIYQSIKTTKTKALAVKPVIEKLISLAKQNSLTAKRHAYKTLGSHRLVSLLFNDIAPRFNTRIGGYIRILNLGTRRGDNAEQVIIELTEIKKRQRRLPKKEKEVKTEEKKKTQIFREEAIEEKKPKTGIEVKEKPPITKKPLKKFLEGVRNIFKKGRDSL